MPKIRSILLILLIATPTFAETTRIRDVIYGRKFGTALTMDVIKPEKQSGIGVVVMVSGGFTSDHAATDGMFSGPIFKRCSIAARRCSWSCMARNHDMSWPRSTRTSIAASVSFVAMPMNMASIPIDWASPAHLPADISRS